MPLPTIVTPSYELNLPSSGKKIKYRPFLVKEEKLMLTIKENQRTDEVMRVMKQVVSNCVIDDKFDDLTDSEVQLINKDLKTEFGIDRGIKQWL